MSNPEENCEACFKCLDGIVKNGLPLTSQMMIICSDCGNKRCPKASDHNNKCTGSNAPGQKGSRYE